MVGRGSGNTDCGVVREGDVYTLRAFKRLLGVGDEGMRNMRRDGLRVVRYGKRAYVSGRDAVAFLEGVGHGFAGEGGECRGSRSGSSVA
jgi:hypothetical protein